MQTNNGPVPQGPQGWLPGCPIPCAHWYSIRHSINRPLSNAPAQICVQPVGLFVRHTFCRHSEVQMAAAVVTIEKGGWIEGLRGEVQGGGGG